MEAALPMVSTPTKPNFGRAEADTDGSGFIDREETLRLLQRCYRRFKDEDWWLNKEEPTFDDACRIFDQLDINGDGVLERSEFAVFLKAVLRKKYLQKTTLDRQSAT